jgi:tocopherol O-methyltransferase
VTARVSTQEIVAYYEPKTQALLRRYGPGPRVHYHTGLVDEAPVPSTPGQELRQRIVAAQERMLRQAAIVWHASSALCGDVLDVGCGLGGGSLFWAQEFDARVTAVTCVPSQIEWVERFAEQAGVASRVQPVLCDAVEMPGDSCFDAAVAVESCCHMPRKALFRRLAALLRPGGRLFIADCFFEQPEYAELFNHHWHAPLGTLNEYLTAARGAGFREESVEEISHRTERFWGMTSLLIQAEARQRNLSPSEALKYEESLQVHTLVQQALADGGLRYALLSFSKEGDFTRYHNLPAWTPSHRQEMRIPLS